MRFHLCLFYACCFLGRCAWATFAEQVPFFGADPTSSLSRSDDAEQLQNILPTALSKEFLSLHKSLVDIESISGNEKKVGEWLASYLERKGFSVEKQAVEKDRYNVYAWTGKKEEAKVLVTSHIDTVPPFIPYSRNSNGDIAGRGTVDAKGSVAAQIAAVLSLLNSNDSASSSAMPPIALLYVVGEETHGDGMKFFSDSSLNRKEYDTVIFGEPTENKLCGGHKGITHFKIRVHGRAAHSGYPWLGLSANDILVQALRVIKILETTPGKDGLPASAKYGNTTMNVGIINGGIATNVVAESAEADVAVRIAASTPEHVKEIVRKALESIKAYTESKGGTIEMVSTTPGYPPIDLECDVDGMGCITVNYGTDVPNLEVSPRTKRYLYGPGSILVAHGANEAVKVEELESAVVDYRKLILRALGSDEEGFTIP